MTMTLRRRLLAATFLLAGAAPFAGSAWAATGAETGAPVAAPAAGAEPNAATDAATVGEVIITARHRTEDAQKAPVAVSVLGGDFLAKTNTVAIAEIAQLEPSVQFSFFNARNANINIRGLGSNVGLANDGLEPGVGFYIDGVYYDRPAAATFDLVDISQIDVLRGPQGTLFGKNTTAGAIDVTTAAPTFTPEATVEVTGGDWGDFESKGSVSGPLIDGVLAGRLSFGTSTHSGYITNAYNGDRLNDERDDEVRGQLLYTPTSNLKVRLIADYDKQNSNCCEEVLAGIVSPPNGKNFTALAKSFGYTPVVGQADTNSLIQARQETGGLSAQVDYTLPGAVLTSITAWRFWNWWPSNDSDYTPLSILTASQNGDHENQVSQELRIASTGENRVDYVAGLYYYHNQIQALGLEQLGNAGSAFLLGATVPSAVLNGYTLNYTANYDTTSYAAYGQAVWHVTPRWNLTLGLRYTDDHKYGSFDQVASGGASLAGDPAALQAARLEVGSDDQFSVVTDQGAVSGQVNLSYQITPRVLAYVDYSHGNKSGGLNLTQLPAGVSPVVAPETIDAYEGGLKTQLFERRLTFNADVFLEQDNNYQANIYDAAVERLYLANVPEVRSGGVEIDSHARPTEDLTLYTSVTWDDAIYASYPDGQCGLEFANLTHCDLSGRPLSGVPRWAASAGGEVKHDVQLGVKSAQVYLGVDYSYRSSLYSAATDSIYTRLPQLTLVNARLGLRSPDGRWDVYLWARNLFGENYYQFIAPGVGNTGQLTGELGDPRTFGATLRLHY